MRAQKYSTKILFKKLILELSFSNLKFNIITHKGNSHKDDYYAIALFLYYIVKLAKELKLNNFIKNIRIIRISDYEIEKYENSNDFNIFIDIGKEYFIPIKFDHHHDSNLNSSLLLLIYALYNIDDIYSDIKKYIDFINIDFIDRYGINSYIDFIKKHFQLPNIENKEILNYSLLLNSPINNLHLKLFSNSTIINYKHYLFKYLYNIGKLLDWKIRLLITNSNFNIQITDFYGYKVIIDLHKRITPILIQKLEIINDKEYDYDFIITKSNRDDSLLSISINPYKELYASDIINKLALNEDIIIFIHKSNKILSLNKYKFLIAFKLEHLIV